MRIFDAKVNVPEDSKSEIEKIGYLTVFENLFNQGALTVYPQGMPAVKGRIWARVLTKIDKAKDDGKTDIELEEAELDVIKDVFLNDRLSYQPAQYRVISQYLDKIAAFNAA